MIKNELTEIAMVVSGAHDDKPTSPLVNDKMYPYTHLANVKMEVSVAPLIILVLVTVVARIAGWNGLQYASSWPKAVAVGLAAMFTITGVTHFHPATRPGLVAIVPPGVPSPELMVSLTGVLEFAGAVGLLATRGRPPVRIIAAWCLTALLALMFPANIYAATTELPAGAPDTPLVPRTLMQTCFLAATLFVALRSRRSRGCDC